LEGVVIDAAGARGAFAALGGIVAAGEAGEAVEEDDDIAAAFDEAFTAFEDEFGDLDVAAGGFVEGGAEDLAGDGFAEVGDFFWAFVDEEDDEFDFRVILADGGGDVLEEDGFAAARGSADETALAFAERGDDIDDAGADGFGFGVFEDDPFRGEERGEFVEVCGRLPVFCGDAFDGDDAFGAEGFFAWVARAAGVDGHFDAWAEIEAPDETGWDEDVVEEGSEVEERVAEDPVPFAGDFEDA
jgi:hypothetical protein